MITAALEPGGSRPLYEQLYLHIRLEISQGRLAAGERLPSKRALASHLKISVVTVEGAYQQLLAEGYIRSEPKRGFFVQPLEPVTPPPQADPAPSPPPLLSAPPLRYDFTTNAVDTAIFPFSTWAKLSREVLSRRDTALLDALPPQGAPELREAIVHHLYRFRGMRVEPEQIVVGAGSEYLTTLLTQLLGRSGGWAVEDPGYPKTARILASNGVEVCPVPLDGQGLQVDALAGSGARVVHVTPSHHFPMGTVMPMGRRAALLSWAEQRPDRYIIEDDYDSEFRFSGRPIPALQGLDRRERVVYLNTFAKSLAPSLRISYLVLPPHLAEEYGRRLLFYASTVPSFEQYTLARFMEGGHFERHIARARTRYRARKAHLMAAAGEAGLLGHGRILGADAGLHFLLQLDDPRPEAELAQLAAQAGVGVYPLSRYYRELPPAGQPPTLVMGYARLPAGDIAPACRQLAAAWGFAPLS
ncbi:MAG: PLP-dependent aminotransferase family protein [Oscillospiraceae bacterium]|nr:PLP-dependent aminotransferase family protein [Oscillospiraceae bacterium]